MQRILVIQLKRIGDFILTVPALAELRSAFPQAEIVLVTTSAITPLAQCVASVDRVVSYEQGRVNFKTWASTLAGPWDLCLDFTGTDRAALLTQLSRAKLRAGYAKFAGQKFKKLAYTHLSESSVRDLHTVDFHLSLLRKVQIPPQAVAGITPWRFPPPLLDKVRGIREENGLSGRFVILHPGTAREEKFWDDTRWAAVAAWIAEQLPSQKVVLTGSGDGLEQPHLQNLRSLLKVPVADLTGRLQLAELLALIRDAALIIGVDSMAMHMAAMCQIPQIAIYGPTNPYHWRARHPASVVLQGDSGIPLNSFNPKAAGSDTNEVSTKAVVDAITHFGIL